jgi:hypothetical protein
MERKDRRKGWKERMEGKDGRKRWKLRMRPHLRIFVEFVASFHITIESKKIKMKQLI